MEIQTVILSVDSRQNARLLEELVESAHRNGSAVPTRCQQSEMREKFSPERWIRCLLALAFAGGALYAVGKEHFWGISLAVVALVPVCKRRVVAPILATVISAFRPARSQPRADDQLAQELGQKRSPQTAETCSGKLQ